MNRTTLNEKTKAQEKLLHCVPILHRLNPHRFLYKNRDFVEQKRQMVDEMRAQVQHLRENLDQYSPHAESSYLAALQLTLSLIKRQGEKTKFSSGQSVASQFDSQDPFNLKSLTGKDTGSVVTILS